MKTSMKAEDLRKSIYQRAIQGKLVPQDPNDEPASVLLERIKAEKEHLIKEGKIKRDKNESFIFKGDDNRYYEKVGKEVKDITEDLPFEIPDSWMWVRQSTVCWLNNGNKEKGLTLPYLEAKVIRGIKTPETKNEGVIVDPRNRVILVDGENSGEIMIPPYKGYLGSTFRLFEKISLINMEYLLMFFSLNLTRYKNSKTGSAIPHLNKELFKDMLLPLPPLSEQGRIMFQIDETRIQLDQYNVLESELESLENNFPEQLKKSILQYAIQGKLVPQDPNDEPASVLLERIKTEKEQLIKEGKIKRDKNESVIYQGDDKNYYEKIPNGWASATLVSIGYITGGGTPDTSNYLYWGGNIIWVTPSDFKKGAVKYMSDSQKKITISGLTNSSAKIIRPQSIIMSSRAPIGYLAINEQKEVTTSQGCKSFTPFSNKLINIEYIFYYLEFNKDDLIKRGSGTTFKEISGTEFGKTKIALPPIRQQNKIVFKMGILETSLNKLTNNRDMI